MLRGVLQIVGLVPRAPVGGGRPRAVHTGGYHWHVLPAGDELFGPDGPPLEAWIRDGAVEVLKLNSQRTVYRVALPDGTMIVKQCRVNGPRAWWREIFRGSKSRLEFDHALALRRHGIAAVEPLAWGSRHRYSPGESFFLTRWEANAVPFEKYLEGLSPIDRRASSHELGRVMAHMHDAGVAHPDPHPGNLLVTFEGGRPRFTLIDLHAIRFGRPLTWRQSLDNLVLLNRWFQLRATRTDRRAFWRAYVQHRTTLPTACPVALAKLAKEVERRTEQSNARFWNSRLDRYQKSNRQYQRLRRGSVAGHAVRDLPAAFVQELLADPDAPFRDPANKVLKDSRSSTVVTLSVPTATGTTVAIFKRFRVKSPVILAKNKLRRSTAMRSWSFGHNLLDRGLPTARPLLVLHRHRLGCPSEGYLLAERVPDAMDLVEATAVATAKPAAERRRIVRSWSNSLGRLIRLMHEKQVAHRDLKAPNILMSGVHPDLAAAVPVLIDLVGVVPGRAVDRTDRVKNLARLNASFIRHPAVTRTDCLRFLRAYLAWGLHGSEGWKDWWRGVSRETLAKVAKNQRSGRPLA
ncbi:lipopolysaccharide kinase InaA family protein [Limnoglobus roseus]|uniref:3-deoxy-D-manno-octulosonic acid kinase n=1 Tax=Limnoglobus roseus TaxID=2598579 RepID=A0A5C1AAQ8_9BACT|nr:lipopolysaccharide kinase InaA family protein [Limnoglobus roseus]QEL14902.1 3-deoxy-D-manno-octulosonic acid kinase [Limnoglobus roseus]